MITDSNYDNCNASDNAYLDNEFSNALERDGQQTPEEQYDGSTLQKDDLDENLHDHQALDKDDLDDDLSERNDEDGHEPEPETFSDDGYKID